MNNLKKITITSLSLLFVATSLAGCGNGENLSATYIDVTASSVYGKISDFSAQNGSLKAGDELKFKVTPNTDYLIKNVTLNGATIATPVASEFYTVKLDKGLNKIAANYTVDKDIDFVSNFKLNISDELFTEVMSNPPTSQADKKNALDFRKDGIEQVMTEYTDPKDAFTNYVDGDTTHVSARNLGYTVKIRYLGIDTPESTSEIEEWGKTASNYNKKQLQTAKHIILEGQGVAFSGNKTPATADGNQRSLAYVWYSDKAAPVKDDFKCLNLEMVYQGFSYGIGAIEDMGENFYYAFDKANKSAEANNRHIYSNDIDENYFYYGDDNKPVNLTLKDLYSTSTENLTNSPYKNNKTLYKVHGYVTRKVGTAFYFQDKPNYEKVGDEAYGMYVFTYKESPISVGDEVNVIGAISDYGGAYQMQGISYHDLNRDENRDTEIVSSNHEIVPLSMTYVQFEQNKYNDVLVNITDDIYCYNKTSSYGGVTSDSGEGGSEEINKYNEAYPFYNTDNKMTFYGKAGSDSGKEARIQVSDGVLLDYNAESAYSYKFFTGGTYSYNYHGAEYANNDENNEYKTDTVSKTYVRKKLGITCMSQNYVSSSGKTQKYTLQIVDRADVDIKGELN
jgi:endonuclease YncB( thermonuclease family)